METEKGVKDAWTEKETDPLEGLWVCSPGDETKCCEMLISEDF